MSRVFPRLMAALALVLALSGCAIGQDGPPSAPVMLLEDAPAPVRAGELVWRGTLHLRDANPDFGGLSSLRVSPDGTQFVAISDRGKRIAGRLSYDREGQLTGAGDYSVNLLLGTDGQPLPPFFNDTEGLALIGQWPGDGWAVSLERRHSILRYPPALAGSAAVLLEVPAGFADLPFNSGIETLLSLADGRLLAIAEGDAGQGRHRAWVGGPGTWAEFAYQALPPFLPVDAARLPGGGILVLERRVGLLGGWGSRIVHVDAATLSASLVPGGVMQGREIARLNPPMATENYEGIDTRPLPGGGVAVYLISDNNFKPIIQRTLLTMFEWGR
ncbi:esterase-like activity of phytase family protein [Niveispirillum sp.]|uniref:esterase-like activity of phytase family protein n=1 Tax=Niveispirillum sp. TaxID=1917217 RepID=UPI001B636255|nr:esterase-like activity of phytase family protein [Niveispirillum sp.]MBP7335824.1 esterase-like activity of phytase family protein [Niveispirillum sp.]